MPEGDVVLRTARRLHAALAGRALVHSELRWPSLATVDLTGRSVTEVVSVGKHLLTRMTGSAGSEPLTLHSHLRMDGSWHIHRTGEPWQPGPHRRRDGVRAVLANNEWTAVGHLLGELDLVPTSQESRLVGHLGPDVLAASWDTEGRDQATANLLADPARPVGEALLDQRVLAGVGTYYLAESLFVRGVTPWTPVADVGDVDALLDVLRRMLWVNANRTVQSTTGDLTAGRAQWVHGRAGRPCRRCGTPVSVAPIGQAPADRVAFYCSRCQEGPRPAAGGQRLRRR